MGLDNIVCRVPGKQVLSDKAKEYEKLLENAMKDQKGLLAVCDGPVVYLKTIISAKSGVDIPADRDTSKPSFMQYYMLKGIGVVFDENEKEFDFNKLEDIEFKLCIKEKDGAPITRVVVNNYRTLIKFFKYYVGKYGLG